MNKDNQNKLLQQVAQLNEIPDGIEFNEVDTWQKIENNLPKKGNRKLVLWFVAASLLVLCSLTFFKFTTNNHKQNIAQKTIEPYKQTQPKLIEQNIEHYKKAAAFVAKNKSEYKNKKNVLLIDTTQATPEEIVIENIKEPFKITDTLPKTVIAKTARKKLKVFYPSDFYNDNTERTKENEKIMVQQTIQKSIIKILEQNNKQEQTESNQNEEPTPKTFLGFKIKTNPTQPAISINNEN